MNNNLIILGTALNPSAEHTTSFGSKRIRQHVVGFERVAEMIKKYNKFDVVLVDNTITNDWQMSSEIKAVLKRIPNIKIITFNENILAAKNKGCGLIAGWKKVFEKIDMNNYDYCIYFEPRILLLDFKFFKMFLDSPATYFQVMRYRLTAKTKGMLVRILLKIVPLFKKQFNVSLFSLKTEQMKKYIDEVNMNDLAEKNISLEDDMYNKLKEEDIKDVKRLGVAWHNAFLNEYIIF